MQPDLQRILAHLLQRALRHADVGALDLVALRLQRLHDVERASIRMPQGPLKQVGEYPLQIGLHTDVTVTVKVSVLGEQ